MQTFGAAREGTRSAYIAACTLIPFASSLIYPVLSLFASTQLHLTALQVSLLFMLMPVATVVIVQLLARASDRGLQRPLIITCSCIGGIGSCAFLELRPPYLMLCSLGVLLMGIQSVGFPQLFASAREFAIKHLGGALMFTTLLRALCSLAWVGGPPIAYFLCTVHSFDLLFAVTAAMFLCGALLAFFKLPSVTLDKDAAASKELHLLEHKQVLLLFAGCIGVSTAFSGYMISMPLYVTTELHLHKNLPGIMLGLAAFLEIPIMLTAARLARRIGLKVIVLSGCLALILFLISLFFLKSEFSLIAVMILPALYIGTTGSMGMVLFQELLPEFPGQATSLFVNSNTVGSILGGALFALADLGSYTCIYAAGIALACIATLGVALVKNPRQIM